MMQQVKPGPFRAVIFDLDGTLLDTIEDISASMNTVLARHEYPVHTVEECRKMVGYGMQELVRSAVPEAAREPSTLGQLQEEMRETYAGNWNRYSRPYEGIGRLLDAIDGMHMKKAILSNKPDAFTKLCADELLASWSFDVVMGHHEGIAHKPDPQGALLIADKLGLDPSSILYVGDSGIDMNTAVAAGMYPLGVSWGYRSVDELRSSGALTIAGEPDEIASFLKNNCQGLPAGALRWPIP